LGCDGVAQVGGIAGHAMKPRLLLIGFSVVSSLLFQPAWAAGDLTKQEPKRFHVELSNAAGEKRFTPDTLQFETGTLTILTISNNSQKSYYFGSNGLADSVYTRKIVVLDKGGKEPLAEIYGPIRKVEVYPGQVLEWWFVPVRTGQFDDLMSRKSEAAAGMKGTIEIR
jgi:hypothetical protein